MKKFNNVKLYIASLLMVCTLSCDSYLDVVPDNIATIDIAFNSRNNAARFFYTLYGYLPQQGSQTNDPSLLSGDEIWVNETSARNWAPSLIAQGNQNVTDPLLNYWSSYDMFVAIRDCNIFLENIHKPRDIEPFERERWIAEAKFLKAYYHFYLLRMYGPIPIIDENIPVEAGSDGVRVERDPVDDVVDFIVSLMDEAIPDLPPFISNIGEELGRLTQPAAAAIKARVLTYSASPIFNGNPYFSTWTNNAGEHYVNQTFDATKWERAAIACKEAVDLAEANGHSLYQYPGSAQFVLSDTTITKMSIRGAVSEPWNSELVWGGVNPTAVTLQNLSYVRTDPNVAAEVVERAGSKWAPTLRMAELFYSDNGVPIEEDTSYDYDGRFDLRTGDSDHRFYIREGYETVGLHFNREPRFHASLSFDGGWIYGQGKFNDKDLWLVQAKAGQVSSAINNVAYSETGYWAKKLIHEKDQLSTSYTAEVFPFPLVRLSDVYLLYAEALNEVSGPSAEVYEYIDRVRSRAGLDGVVDSWSAHSVNPTKPNTKEGLREIIHQERLIELAFEGKRFWDLRRWLKLADQMNKPLRGWNIRQPQSSEYYRPITIFNPSFSNRDYLWPISEDDLIANPNLDQAPGW